MLDKDGSYSYSKVMTVALQSAGSFLMAPNPSKGISQISYRFPDATNGSNTLTVVNTIGNVIKETKLAQQGTILLDLSTQPPGVYLVVLRQNHTIVETKKIVIAR